jgi:hypothetical protein
VTHVEVCGLRWGIGDYSQICYRAAEETLLQSPHFQKTLCSADNGDANYIFLVSLFDSNGNKMQLVWPNF